MAYDEALAVRVRQVLADEAAISERKMFGGLCFMASGRMCCGVLGSDLVLRVAPESWETALGRPHTRPMDFTGRPMRGFLYVAPGGTRDGRSLRRWVGEGVAFARKAAKAGPGRRTTSRRLRAGRGRRRA